MSQTDIIANLLEIENAEVEKVENTDTEKIVYFRLKKRPHECPVCRNVTEYVYDYRTQKELF